MGRLLVFVALGLLAAGCGGTSIRTGSSLSGEDKVDPPVETVRLTEKLTTYRSLSIHVRAEEGLAGADAMLPSFHERLVKTARKAKPGPDVLVDASRMGELDLRATIQKLERTPADKNFWGEIPETMVVVFELVEPTQGRVLASFIASATRNNEADEPTFAPAAAAVARQVSLWFWSKKSNKQQFIDSFTP